MSHFVNGVSFVIELIITCHSLYLKAWMVQIMGILFRYSRQYFRHISQCKMLCILLFCHLWLEDNIFTQFTDIDHMMWSGHKVCCENNKWEMLLSMERLLWANSDPMPDRHRVYHLLLSPHPRFPSVYHTTYQLTKTFILFYPDLFTFGLSH